jgi:hypothetical protein
MRLAVIVFLISGEVASSARRLAPGAAGVVSPLYFFGFWAFVAFGHDVSFSKLQRFVVSFSGGQVVEVLAEGVEFG